ncbi:type 1 glutamine amidotransferase domain-containing protein [Chlorogloeopsis fritschii PCC 9212]|uniref:Dihydroxyacetone kinase n=1 Tax=Chlorogloeopsis fritschii PCC 6912 TaxID=211165 RepID=A0A3S0XY77_CHLFR|nr:type 1 glutamine amidotransferase domain-containing protein [Chlorogloeopsis fritschii]RUR72395.1 dihydroxyacetone kinase [Chlorogloeopsis fritschii PCC 6912]
MFNLKTSLTLLFAAITLTGCIGVNAQRVAPVTSNTPTPKKILIVLTNHEQLGNTGQKTGFYLDEATHPHAVFTQAGFEVDFASPTGEAAPIDPKSYKLNDPLNKKFVENPKVMAKVEDTLSPEEVKPSEYKAIFFAGGHGTMWDFPNNQKLAQLTAAIYEQGGVVGAVCHGPAALVNVKLSNDAYLVAGKTVAAFTNEEEAAVGLTKIMPFLLESKLIERGAKHTEAPNFQAHVVVSDRLVTGQNPASAIGVAEQMVRLLK